VAVVTHDDHARSTTVITTPGLNSAATHQLGVLVYQDRDQ